MQKIHKKSCMRNRIYNNKFNIVDFVRLNNFIYIISVHVEMFVKIIEDKNNVREHEINDTKELVISKNITG